ncbi:MAG: hypothetical protein C0506_03920 [Anaerolinea sp.]|nr:hypothetical protein [Anaerolinea sp.]
MTHDFEDDHRPLRDRIYGDATAGRDGRRGLATIALAVSVFLLVAAVSARQLTAPGPARSILESGIALTTEIEQVIAEDHDALRQLVESNNSAVFTIPDYPLDVVLTRDEILKSTDAQLRETVLARSSGLVYAHGLDAFDRTGNQSFGQLSTQRLLEFGVGQFSQETHRRANVLSVVFLLATAAAACFVVASREGWGRSRALGLATILGAVPGILIVGLVWLAVGRMGGGDPFVADLRQVVQTALLAPLRNYLAVFILGALLAALGVAMAMIDARLEAPAGGAVETDEAI